jgi:hypothetical protein
MIDDASPETLPLPTRSPGTLNVESLHPNP